MEADVRHVRSGEVTITYCEVMRQSLSVDQLHRYMEVAFGSGTIPQRFRLAAVGQDFSESGLRQALTGHNRTPTGLLHS